MVSAVVLDLDHTLFDPRTHPDSMVGTLAARLRAVAHGAVPATILDQALEDCWRHPFNQVLASHPLPEAVTAGWRRIMREAEVTEPLRPYPEVPTVLARLASRRFLLTTGFRRLQGSKLERLGLRPLFERVYLDSLDEPEPPGKRALLEQILDEHRLRPDDVVVVGDRGDDELAAARSLGIMAIQVLRPGVVPSEVASVQIPDLAPLPDLLET